MLGPWILLARVDHDFFDQTSISILCHLLILWKLRKYKPNLTEKCEMASNCWIWLQRTMFFRLVLRQRGSENSEEIQADQLCGWALFHLRGFIGPRRRDTHQSATGQLYGSQKAPHHVPNHRICLFHRSPLPLHYLKFAKFRITSKSWFVSKTIH